MEEHTRTRSSRRSGSLLLSVDHDDNRRSLIEGDWIPDYRTHKREHKEYFNPMSYRYNYMPSTYEWWDEVNAPNGTTLTVSPSEEGHLQLHVKMAQSTFDITLVCRKQDKSGRAFHSEAAVSPQNYSEVLGNSEDESLQFFERFLSESLLGVRKLRVDVYSFDWESNTQHVYWKRPRWTLRNEECSLDPFCGDWILVEAYTGTRAATVPRKGTELEANQISSTLYSISIKIVNMMSVVVQILAVTNDHSVNIHAVDGGSTLVLAEDEEWMSYEDIVYDILWNLVEMRIENGQLLLTSPMQRKLVAKAYVCESE